MSKQITVTAMIDAPIDKVWDAYTNPTHIVKWSHASEDWTCPHAESDLTVGGKFLSRMEAKDGSMGFDFSGTYTEVIPQKRISYTMDGADNRKATIEFDSVFESTDITVAFDLESENPVAMQEAGWKAILDNFKNYAEKLVK